jgi:hypothetical protein
MHACPACSGEVPEGSRFCPACGVKLAAEPLPRTGPYQPPDNPVPANDYTAAPFTPGQTLAGRYRIVALLGRGGMGEVYRADDLTLGQAVALKFLPEALARDPQRLERFRQEVRLARQVSHPNVCRVYDIGEVEGQPFLTMEYIDGEDLAALLQRIGRLPQDKGIELARELCLGLAAAHDRGVLHRDLKPRNVMIDARGRMRLTDFGLAVFAAEVQGPEVRSGTPAYMAPEQRAGREVTVRSDVYALGLVLYEMFTGQRAFPSQLHEEQTPASPSSWVKDIDPAVERIILRCLERNPQDRPGSALAVAAVLPGGDPLAAAVAAGETPSPEMVEDAPGQTGLSPRAAAALLTASVLSIVLIALLADRTMLFRQVPLTEPPEIMARKARSLLADLGYPDPPRDSAYYYYYNQDYLDYVSRTDASPSRWDGLAAGRPAAMFFFYRQSPEHLVLGLDHRNDAFLDGAVTPTNPPPVVSGMASVHLDLKGRLLELHVVPPQRDESTEPAPAPDWPALFRAAGLEMERFTNATPQWNPPAACDARGAWTGAYPERPELLLRVEAAAYRGKATDFQFIGPWTTPRQMPHPPTAGMVTAGIILVTFCLAVVLLALRNLRRGRADRRGVLRLTLISLAWDVMAWLVGSHHVPGLGELTTLDVILGPAVIRAVLFALVYLAVEPPFRRRWPWQMISWKRMLAGRVRDPLVGRDLLIGVFLGSVFLLLAQASQLAVARMGLPPPVPFYGIPYPWVVILRMVLGYSARPMMLMTFFLALLLIVRKPWLAWTFAFAFLLLVEVVSLLVSPPISAGETVYILLLEGLWLAAVLLVMFRFGLLAAVLAEMFHTLLSMVPITTDLSAWYARDGLIAVLVVLGLAVYGFVISLGGRPLFRAGFFPDD